MEYLSANGRPVPKVEFQDKHHPGIMTFFSWTKENTKLMSNFGNKIAKQFRLSGGLSSLPLHFTHRSGMEISNSSAEALF